ncbi:MAG: hypothetical protein LBV61_00335 [Burkholderiaceae bacterium]|jgi:uncharacterized membrane protein|nr:hypothetical protein [Burkholderiaceae bacterium]
MSTDFSSNAGAADASTPSSLPPPAPSADFNARPGAGAPAPGDDTADALKTWGWVSYILHLIVAIGAVAPGTQMSVTLLLVALVLDLVKRDDAAGTWQASHFSWRIRSVLGAGIAYVLTSWLWLLFLIPGWIAWTLISLWFLYRIIKGMVRMNANKPMEPQHVI